MNAKLAVKMVAAMNDIEAVTKSGKNTKQDYKYVKAADVANEVRKVLVKHGIAFFYSVEGEDRWEKATNSGGSMFLCRLFINVTFVDSETGESFTTQFIGWGADSLEKAPYKAMTGALKYALRMTFLIPDEEDPENETHNETIQAAPAVKANGAVKVLTSAQAEELREALVSSGKTRTDLGKLCASLGVKDGSAYIPANRFKESMEWIRGESEMPGVAA